MLDNTLNRMKFSVENLYFLNSTKLIIVMLVCVLAFLQYELWLSDGGVRSLLNLHSQIFAQKEVISSIAKTNNILTADILDLKNGGQAIEERARENLGMTKSNETYYQFIQ